MKNEERDDIPPPFEHLAEMIKGNASTRGVSAMRPVLLRLPEHLLAELDAVSVTAGKSRNSMATHLLDAAIHEVHKNLDRETSGKINLATLHNLEAFNANAADREAGEY